MDAVAPSPAAPLPLPAHARSRRAHGDTGGTTEQQSLTRTAVMFCEFETEMVTGCTPEPPSTRLVLSTSDCEKGTVQG